MLNISSIEETKTYAQVVQDSAWQQAMAAKIGVLRRIRLGVLFLCLQGRDLLGVNGTIELNIIQMVVWKGLKPDWWPKGFTHDKKV